MENIETKLGNSLTAEERKAVQDKIDDSIISIIDRLSADKRQKIYDSIVPKPKDEKYLKQQAEWISVFIYYLGRNREKQGLDCSRETMDRLLIDELISGDGRVMRQRYRLYRAARYKDEIYLKSLPLRILRFLGINVHTELTDFLKDVDKTIEPYMRSIQP